MSSKRIIMFLIGATLGLACAKSCVNVWDEVLDKQRLCYESCNLRSGRHLNDLCPCPPDMEMQNER